MSRRRKEPLRALTQAERAGLERIARAGSEQAEVVARAKEVLAVADGLGYQAAAVRAGRRSRDAVSELVSRFNREGLTALEPHRGGGRRPTYDAAARERILALARRAPDPVRDGTASWSLTSLQRALRRDSPAFARISTATIWQALHAGGLRYLATRSWCETGQIERRRKAGTVVVVDPDAEAKKKSDRAGVSRG
jgi:transposase